MKNKLKRRIKKIIVILNYLRFILHLISLWISPKTQREILFSDVYRWLECYNLSISNRGGYSIVWLLTFYNEFRNLFYYRIKISKLFSFLAKGTPNLYINCENIGNGFFLQHGFSTVISAKSIGENSWINQQVTIGYTSRDDAPTIGNNVKIFAGAIIVGNVKIGDNAIIGAGAVVVKDVPENTTVVGAPARYIKH